MIGRRFRPPPSESRSGHLSHHTPVRARKRSNRKGNRPTMTDPADLARLRADYETEVRALRARAEAMLRQGLPGETIARDIHARRRDLALRFKLRTPEPMRTALYARTARKYGDPLGPSIETLRAMGRTWDEIIASAARPGALDDMGG